MFGCFYFLWKSNGLFANEQDGKIPLHFLFRIVMLLYSHIFLLKKANSVSSNAGLRSVRTRKRKRSLTTKRMIKIKLSDESDGRREQAREREGRKGPPTSSLEKVSH